MISKSVIRSSSLSIGREPNTRSVIRRKVRMLLAERAEAVKPTVPANPFGTKENLRGAKRRKPVMI